ncbi:hypothetical protein Q8A73_011203 [Channa argus]|nr:hypothetical protein Q8A73_011203 [Channa argus]
MERSDGDRIEERKVETSEDKDIGLERIIKRGDEWSEAEEEEENDEQQIERDHLAPPRSTLRLPRVSLDRSSPPAVFSTELDHDTERPLWPETPGNLTAAVTEEEDEEKLCGKRNSGGGRS